MPFKNPTLRIARFLKGHTKTLVFLGLLIALSSAFDIAVPFISQRLIDTLINFFKAGGGTPMRVLIFSAIGILLATIASRIAESAYGYNLFKFVTKIEDHIRHLVFEKYLRLHALFHHQSSSGQIIGRIERGGVGFYVILHDIVGLNLFPPLVVFLGILIVLLFKNPWIALTVFLPLPIYLLAIQRLTTRIYEIEKRANDEFENVAKEAYDVAGNVLTVKKFAQESIETIHQTKLRGKARDVQYGAERLWTVIENIQTFIATTGRIAVIVLAGMFALTGKSTIGEFVLYITLQNMAYTPLSKLSNIFPRLKRNLARVERLFDIMDEPEKVIDTPHAQPLPPLKQSIAFKKVWFRYHDGSPWAAKDISVVIPSKNTVALVGRSGSGKTTLINLLLRSYDPVRGSITVDGHDLRDVTRESLLNQIAVVPQEVDLFSRTIFENIAYGKLDVAKEDVMEAAKTALAHDFIMKTERGYETLVGERGIKLSGGERQRIGIARAVLRDPKILILDEATSHLDTESEKLIARATNALIKNRTTIIIAHRLSTILHADMIIVFKSGIIEAVGGHVELLRKSETYRRLYNLQFKFDGDRR